MKTFDELRIFMGNHAHLEADMVNVENINRMIEAIRGQEYPIRMSAFVTENSECGTTACLAGWANVLRFNAQGNGASHGSLDENSEYYDFADSSKAAKWMGISLEQADALFYEYRVDGLGPEDRKAAAIELLELLRDTGDAAWSDVVSSDRYFYAFA